VHLFLKAQQSNCLCYVTRGENLGPYMMKVKVFNWCPDIVAVSEILNFEKQFLVMMCDDDLKSNVIF
jgi:hypothetical protein